MSSLAKLVRSATARIRAAAKHGPLLLAYSGGKDAVAVAILLRESGVPFRCVCETSFYFARQEADVRGLAARLGLDVTYRRSRDLQWLRRHPAVIFADDPRIRSWSFQQRQQRTVRREQCCGDEQLVAVFGRRREENTVQAPLYRTTAGWQCHPIVNWRTFDVWALLEARAVAAPWIYSTVFGQFEGNAPFYTLRARDVGGVDRAWEIVSSLDARYTRELVLGRDTA